MAEITIDVQADELLAELGIATGTSSTSDPPPPRPPPPADGPAPPAPPPPPPPPPASSGGFRPSAKAKKNAQDDINDVFDSVISFAGKTSAKKSKVPPPVAPKPKRKIHVSSYTMKVKSPTSKDAPKSVAVPAAPPAPAAPPPPAAASKEEDSKKRVPSEGGIVPKVDTSIPEPVPMTAFGPGTFSQLIRIP